MSGGTRPGAFVVSLDFELAWGFGRNALADEACKRRLLGARGIIPQLLDIFEEFDVAATWAIVGSLFAESKMELEAWGPKRRPEYLNPALSPSAEEIGEDEHEDPFHFAPSLIRAIHGSPRQEVATHTFSHYYCFEPGQNRETFSEDVEAARAVAERRGIRLRSIVFPRNQHNPEYDDILLDHGISGYRGNPRSWAWRFDDTRESRHAGRRAMRLIDAYAPVSGSGAIRWEEVLGPSRLSNIRATRPLGPYRPNLKDLEERRFKRIRQGIRHAARNGEIFHIWWHPHNFGLFPNQNMSFLRRVLEEVGHCRAENGLLSLSMADVDDMVRRRSDLYSEPLSLSQ